MKTSLKTITALLSICAVSLILSAPTYAADEGIDYRVVSKTQPTANPKKIEVLEIFWYGCPHCYHMESDLQRWLAHKPEYVEFRRMPAASSNWAIGAKIFYAAELLGVLDRINGPLFKAVHEEYLQITDENKVAEWFVTQGVAKDDFLGALHSFAVDSKVRRAAQAGIDLEIQGVPCFLVNGKYFTSPSMTASIPKTFEVIDAIVAEEAQRLGLVAAPTPNP